MNHFTEEDLIAFHLREPSDNGLGESATHKHLEDCPTCAALSDSIAETLRVFSAEPVPAPDLDRNWHRLRSHLAALSPGRRRFQLPGLRIAAPLAALLLLVIGGLSRNALHLRRQPDGTTTEALSARGPSTNAAVATHLESAERLLTEVNHEAGPLDDTTRAQAHDMLLKNAVYTRSAYDRGDLAQAAVLDNLGRVLTSVDNAPPTPHSTLDLRLQMNTSGLLFEIRILRQNDNRR